jgi:mannose-6-phosphate isomerase-like protein (cupin superfamily)
MLALAGDEMIVHNPGSTDTVVAFVALASILPNAHELLHEVGPYDLTLRTNEVLVDAMTDPLPGGPAKIVLERHTLLPGAVLPPFEATGFEWLGISVGAVGITLEGERLPFRWRSGEERTLGRGQPLPKITAGTRASLRNAGEEPLVLYRLIITPAGESAANITNEERLTQTRPGEAAPATGTLIDASVDDLLAGHTLLLVERWRFRPGPTSGSLPPADGPTLLAVETGTLAVTVDGSQRTLGAGEPIVVPAGLGITMHNPGSTDTFVYIVSLALWTDIHGQSDLALFDYDQTLITVELLIGASTDALPGGPAQIVLERHTLPPGATLTPFEATGLDWLGVGAGSLGLTLAGERLPFRWQPGEEQKILVGQPLPIITPGTMMTLRNAGDDPLVCYRLIITPTGEAAANVTNDDRLALTLPGQTVPATGTLVADSGRGTAQPRVTETVMAVMPRRRLGITGVERSPP